ncbi:MAG: hypothetical protein HQM01_02320 [Magnetococcales bacterium]|nr:hypothetical protein [Magnetococcales bacterium]
MEHLETVETIIKAIIVVTSLWVLIDARAIGIKRGQIPGFLGMGWLGWFLACLLLWLFAFPAYLIKRGAYKRINGT